MGLKDRLKRLERKVGVDGKSYETHIVIIKPGDNEEEILAKAREEHCGKLIIIRYPEGWKPKEERNNNL